MPTPSMCLCIFMRMGRCVCGYWYVSMVRCVGKVQYVELVIMCM